MSKIQIPQHHNPHPLKRDIEALDLRLWQISLALGGSPSIGHLSRMLCGQVPMPPKYEAGIRSVIEAARESQSTVSA
ncbi:MAG: hypothetical protein ACLFQY_21020 [Desulfococcaceae bacterium]